MRGEVGKIVILGLDGCPMELVESWARRGILPNFSRLMDDSAWGVLQSTYPPITIPAWLSFSTGKDPGKLGLYGFFTFPDGSYDLEVNRHEDVREHLELWDYLNAEGLSCGILNYPVMDRPIKLNGFCVPGFMATEASYETHPAELRKELDTAVDRYELLPAAQYLIGEEDLVADSIRIIRKRAAAIRHLMRERPVDVLVAVFYLTDTILHRLYRKYGPGRYETDDPTGNPLARFFQELDSCLGEILEDVAGDDLLIVMSDHGMSLADRAFLINKWFMQKGWLSLKKKRLLSRVGITQKKIEPILRKTGLYNLAREVPSFLKKRIPKGQHFPGEGVHVEFMIQEDLVDWEKTAAVAMDAGPYVSVYFNTVDRPRGVLAGDEPADFMEELLASLGKVVDFESGKELTVKAYTAEELYSEGRGPNAPDLFIELGDGILPSRNLREDEELFGDFKLQPHTRDGMLIVRHPAVVKGRFDSASLIDITPTVLNIAGIPSFPEIDGRVLRELFQGGSLMSDTGQLETGECSGRDWLERKRISSAVRGIRGL
jgi:predicted AlkP superfamily phosphohydrolase/phosphomutase